MVYKEKDCVERSISPDAVAFYTVFFFFGNVPCLITLNKT